MKPVLETKRLTLRPMTDEEMRLLIDQETDPEMREAYGSMLNGAQAQPAQRLWYIAWRIARRDGEPVGDLCFKGGPRYGAVDVGYGIASCQRGNGYATEAVKAIVSWAFTQPETYYVTAETDPGNAASQRVLAKAGFVPDGMGREGPRFIMEKPSSNWLSIDLALGMGIGAAFGAGGNIALGISLGMCVGVALGLALDATERKARAQHRAAYEAGKDVPLERAAE